MGGFSGYTVSTRCPGLVLPQTRSREVHGRGKAQLSLDYQCKKVASPPHLPDSGANTSSSPTAPRNPGCALASLPGMLGVEHGAGPGGRALAWGCAPRGHPRLCQLQDVPGLGCNEERGILQQELEHICDGHRAHTNAGEWR